MGLADIAAGLEVTTEQRDRGVATVDRTEQSLADLLEPHEEQLPCSATAAATVLEQYVGGKSVGVAARAAGIAPMTAAKTLHLLGESVHPLGPTAREVVRDWLDGELARTDAVELTRATETEFALAVYVETHEPLAEACGAVEETLVAKHRPADDPLADTRSNPTDLL